LNRRDWAELLVASIPPEVRLAIAEAPAQALRDHLGLKVTPSEHLSRREAGGWCDGVSFSEGGEILYAPTPWSDRENFTITHELGHLLVDAEQDEEILVWSADLPAKAIEEVCDMVASRLLLSDEAIQEALGGDQPTGLAVLRLFKSSNASCQAVAVALAQRLPCEGFVALVRDGRVSFAARQADTRPYAWRGDEIPSGHPIGSVPDHGEIAVETFWAAPWGDKRRFYMSACRRKAWTYAVFAEHDLFGATKLHLPEVRSGGPRPDSRAFTCPSCGYSRNIRRWPCPTCHEYECPQCEKCGCTRKEEATRREMCRRCMQFVRVELLVDGLCDQCR
jgi:hypothetical protein